MKILGKDGSRTRSLLTAAIGTSCLLQGPATVLVSFPPVSGLGFFIRKHPEAKFDWRGLKVPILPEENKGLKSKSYSSVYAEYVIERDVSEYSSVHYDTGMGTSGYLLRYPLCSGAISQRRNDELSFGLRSYFQNIGARIIDNVGLGKAGGTLPDLGMNSNNFNFTSRSLPGVFNHDFNLWRYATTVFVEYYFGRFGDNLEVRSILNLAHSSALDNRFVSNTYGTMGIDDVYQQPDGTKNTNYEREKPPQCSIARGICGLPLSAKIGITIFLAAFARPFLFRAVALFGGFDRPRDRRPALLFCLVGLALFCSAFPIWW